MDSKIDANELIYGNRNRLQDIENRLRAAKGVWGGKDWECGINRCTLLCVREINNKILLYSTGNYIQYAGIKHTGKKRTWNQNIY